MPDMTLQDLTLTDQKDRTWWKDIDRHDADDTKLLVPENTDVF